MIIMTAHGDSTAAIDAMKLGAFDYVAKPIDFDTLLPQLRRAIEHRKLARSAAGEGRSYFLARMKAPRLVMVTGALTFAADLST